MRSAQIHLEIFETLINKGSSENIDFKPFLRVFDGISLKH